MIVFATVGLFVVVAIALGQVFQLLGLAQAEEDLVTTILLSSFLLVGCCVAEMWIKQHLRCDMRSARYLAHVVATSELLATALLFALSEAALHAASHVYRATPVAIPITLVGYGLLWYAVYMATRFLQYLLSPVVRSEYADKSFERIVAYYR